MSPTVRILLLEDVPADAELVDRWQAHAAGDIDQPFDWRPRQLGVGGLRELSLGALSPRTKKYWTGLSGPHICVAEARFRSEQSAGVLR